MPRRDATGPWGMGPMTGRAAGYCTGKDMPGYFNHYALRGPGMGFGRGHGRGGRCGGIRSRFAANGMPGRSGWNTSPTFGPADPEAQKQFFRKQAQDLQHELESIQKRLAELEADDKKDRT